MIFHLCLDMTWIYGVNMPDSKDWPRTCTQNLRAPGYYIFSFNVSLHSCLWSLYYNGLKIIQYGDSIWNRRIGYSTKLCRVLFCRSWESTPQMHQRAPAYFFWVTDKITAKNIPSKEPEQSKMMESLLIQLYLGRLTRSLLPNSSATQNKKSGTSLYCWDLEI